MATANFTTKPPMRFTFLYEKQLIRKIKVPEQKSQPRLAVCCFPESINDLFHDTLASLIFSLETLLLACNI